MPGRWSIIWWKRRYELRALMALPRFVMGNAKDRQAARSARGAQKGGDKGADKGGHKGRLGHVAIGAQLVPLTIRRHPRSRSISLRIDAARRGLAVTMPHWVAEREALNFIESRRAWIEERLAALGPDNLLGDSDMVPFRGQDYRISWSATAKRTPLLQAGRLELGGEEMMVGRRVERWLKAQAQRVFAADLAHYCAQANHGDVPKIGLSNARRRWGSCSQSGWVRVQWRLIMAPDFVRRAVIAHEVAHLRHMDHSPRFYDWLDTIYEGDRRAADSWLKVHGNTLHALRFA